MICKKIIASGRVQGVYYRASLQRKARELGLLGYVKNLPNGNVEAFVVGDSEKISDLVKWCWEGPPLAAVTKVEIIEGEDQLKNEFTEFEIRR